MNVVILQGNLTHQPELKYVEANGKSVAVCNFSIATHRYYHKANGDKNKETTFIDCEAWDSGAETIAKYMHKGDPFLVRGSIKNDIWDNKEGKRVSKIRIRVEEFELPPKSSRNNITATSENTTVDQTESQLENKKESVANGDDIPF